MEKDKNYQQGYLDGRKYEWKEKIEPLLREIQNVGAMRLITREMVEFDTRDEIGVDWMTGKKRVIPAPKQIGEYLSRYMTSDLTEEIVKQNMVDFEVEDYTSDLLKVYATVHIIPDWKNFVSRLKQN